MVSGKIRSCSVCTSQHRGTRLVAQQNAEPSDRVYSVSGEETMKRLLRNLAPPAAIGLLVLLSCAACAPARDLEIEAALVHPPVAAPFQCSEHALGSEDHVPDALGADCVVVRRDGGPNGNLNSLHSGDGTRNEDWHGWRQPLLAPCDGVVLIVSLNPETTTPGEFGSGRSSAMLFRCSLDDDANAVKVAYIHVREVSVAEGDTVQAGQTVARIGNNGSSYNPHVHIGAFRGELMSDDAVPLQIRFDLAAMGRLSGLVREGR
jgi:Peptidase family M23